MLLGVTSMDVQGNGDVDMSLNGEGAMNDDQDAPVSENSEQGEVVKPMNTKPSNSASHMPQTRSEIYMELRKISELFEKIEPQSPTTNVLKKIAEWEHKDLGEIISFFTQGGDAMSILMKFISKDKAESPTA